jgi:glucosamine--fructose-6-phosphate aminotransferase (isomerizing)
MEIREELRKRGVQLQSDTDSELVAHLISFEVDQKGLGLEQAVFRVLPQLRGAFSILVISEREPEVMICFKDGPPLVLGLGENQNFVASDVQALLEYTRKFVILDDRQVAIVKIKNIELYDAFGRSLPLKETHYDWNPESADKLLYPHYMLKEIYEQPRAFSQALESFLSPERDSLQLPPGILEDNELVRGSKKLFIVACGTSFYAGMLAKYFFEQLAHLSVEVDVASEFRYRQPVIQKGDLLLTISQSGETADTLAALRLAKEKGARILSLCNVKNSSIDREAEGHLYMNAGPEIGVASTKAFTSSLAVLAALALRWGQLRGVMKPDDVKEHLRALVAVPSQMEVVLAYDKYFDEASEKLKKYRGFLYMGRGVSYPIALEGALKLKELAYFHAEGYAAGEMKHGPLALIDKNMAIVMIAPSDSLYEKTLSNLEEAKARGGQIISLGTADNPRLRSVSEYYLSIPQGSWITNPILAVIPLQLMSYHLACHLGFDVDQPRNLAKSVTVE